MLTYHDFEELLLYAYGNSEEKIEDKINNHFDIDELIYEKLIEGDDLTGAVQNLISKLMSMIIVGESPLTKKVYKGFGIELKTE
ncbi:unnamed protein product [marine sediment metagenome]|uniref:Uncharacterized protein n=1 Tax=marine sediment metagenome TaxID=412755 RepID=X1TN57_9ZZZZ